MTESYFKAPDLLSGHMLNAYEFYNCWSTGILSVLTVTEPNGKVKRAYLSQPCRAEASIGETALSNTIFQNPYEFCVIQGWDDAYVLRAGAFWYPLAFREDPYWDEKRYGVFEYPSKVECQYRDANVVNFDDALQGLVEGRVCANDIYMRVTWRADGERYDLFCPSRYINFPSNADTEQAYLQPVSDPVLYHDGNRFYLAGIACAMVNKQQGNVIEFVLRVSKKNINLRTKGRFAKWAAKLLAFITSTRPDCDEYAQSVRLEGECVLFTYDANDNVQ